MDMIPRVHSVLLSLMEVLQLVRQSYREHVVGVLQRVPPSQSVLPLRTWEYDPRQYVAALVEEINTMQASSPEVGGSLRSTQLLVDAGLDPTSATLIAHACFQLVTDLITANAPEASFGGDGEWSYQLVNECDLQISTVYEHYIQEPEREPTITEEILAERDARSRRVAPGIPTRWFEPDPEPAPQMLNCQQIDAMNGGMN